MPAIELTKAFKGTQTGNVIFWLTIMLGQPMIVLLYARDYHQGMYGPWTAADTQTVANILLGFTTTWQQAIGGTYAVGGSTNSGNRAQDGVHAPLAHEKRVTS